MSDIIVPSMGESVSEGVISIWLKKDGDFVQVGEPLFELETDKITTEVPAQGSGVLRVKVQEGSKVSIGAVVGKLENGAVQTPAAVEASTVAVRPVEATTLTLAPTPVLSPSQRRKALEQPGTVPAQVAAVPVKVLSTPVTPNAPVRKRMPLLRQKIAERLVAAKNTTAMLTTFNEIEMTAVLDLRQRFRENFQKVHGVDLGFMSFFIKAAVSALKAFPSVNAQIDGSDMLFFNQYDIGVAVSTDRGLMVPVVRHADRLSFADLERAIAGFAAKAREGTIAVDDLQGGTFTITNGGVFGSLMATPILNPPQSAILGMHAMQKRPVVRSIEGVEQIVVRQMMYVALSYDHRMIDGRESVGFLKHIKEYVENPVKTMLDL